MKPIQALTIIDNALQECQVSRKVHEIYIEAINTLRLEIDKNINSETPITETSEPKWQNKNNNSPIAYYGHLKYVEIN